MPIHHQDLRIPTTPSERNPKNPPSPTAPTSCHHAASPTDAQDFNMTSLAPTAPTQNNSPTSLTIPLLAPALSTNNHQQGHTGPAVRSPHHQNTDAFAHSPQPTSGLTPATHKTCSTYVHPGPHHHA
jgi:hypothetical protein